MSDLIHPQNAVPRQVFDDIAAFIRCYGIAGDELHDITVAVDLGEEAPASADADLYQTLMLLADVYDVSAEFLVDEACVCLGWPVTA
jgi:hypothetical protein